MTASTPPPAAAPAPAEDPRGAGTASHPDFDFVEESGGIEAYRLRSNGLRVLLLPEAAAPVAAFMITYHVGSRDEVPGTTGATHILEHLMFKGTERFNKALGTSVFNRLQAVGARVNATTWLDRTNYYELLPSEHLGLAVEIEADRMRNALIAEDDLRSERTVILNEFDRGENEPIRKLYHDLWSTAFIAHPYHHPTIGWRSDIESVSAGQLRAFYDTFYWPNNATASVIGDVDPGQALELISRHFGPISPSPEPIPRIRTREPEQRGERRFVLRQAGEIGTVMRAYKAPEALHPDADALDALARILAAGKSSRFYRRLTDTGLTSTISAIASRHADPGLFVAYAMLTPGTPHERVEAEMDEVLEEVRDAGVDEAELQRAKNRIRAQEAYGRDGPYKVAAQLNEAIAAGDWKLYTTYFDRINRVTTEDVHRVARRYLRPERSTTGHYIPSPSSESPEAAPAA